LEDLPLLRHHAASREVDKTGAMMVRLTVATSGDSLQVVVARGDARVHVNVNWRDEGIGSADGRSPQPAIG
jgi:hypothetical protein